MNNQKKTEESSVMDKAPEKETNDTRPVCGLIMPIADTDGYPVGHWKEVKKLYISIAEEEGFRTRLVSDSDDVRIIQKNIVQNVFDDDIIICDVSSKNPNVMFELGLRLAFDKAAVIVKDDATGYSFDTSPIAHINYPKDLRYYDIEKFKVELKAKLKATYKESLKSNHSMYLESFGKFVIKELKTHEITDSQYVLESLQEIKNEIRSLRPVTNATIVNREFRNSSPTTLSHQDNLNNLFQSYLESLEIGATLNDEDYHNYVTDIADIMGEPKPSKKSTSEIFRKNVYKNNK